MKQYNFVFSTLDRTMIIKYLRDFFGYPQANTLSDINITRDDIIDAIKTISQNSSGKRRVLLKEATASSTSYNYT